MALVADLLALALAVQRVCEDVSATKRTIKVVGRKMETLALVLREVQSEGPSPAISRVLSELRDEIGKTQELVEKARSMSPAVYILKAKGVREDLEERMRHIQFSLMALESARSESLRRQVSELHRGWLERDMELRREAERERLERERLQRLLEGGGDGLTGAAGIQSRRELEEVMRELESETEELRRDMEGALDEVVRAKAAMERDAMEQLAAALRMVDLGSDTAGGSIDQKDPASMSIKELKAAVRKAGLESEAVGLIEKSEFVALLQDHVHMASSSTVAEKIPEWCLCPVTFEVMTDPVIVNATCNQTVDRKSFEDWIGRGHTTCPACGVELRSRNVSPNVPLRGAIEHLMAGRDDGSSAHGPRIATPAPSATVTNDFNSSSASGPIHLSPASPPPPVASGMGGNHSDAFFGAAQAQPAPSPAPLANPFDDFVGVAQSQPVPSSSAPPAANGIDGNPFDVSDGGAQSPTFESPAAPSLAGGLLPPGGETYDVRIFTPTLGAMFLRPDELTESLFHGSNQSTVKALANRPVVGYIVEGSSAESVGINLGHVLLNVNGTDVKDLKEGNRLIKEGPRPLPMTFYVPNINVVVSEGECMVKYDTLTTNHPKAAKDWKTKYVVIGGLIVQPWMLNMYKSKREYDIAVIETQARRPVSVKVKQFSIHGARILNDSDGTDSCISLVKYKFKPEPWRYFVLQPASGNPVKIAAPSLVELMPVYTGIRRVLQTSQA